MSCMLVQEMDVFVGIDLDPTAHRIAQQRLEAVKSPHLQTHFVRGNYRYAAGGMFALRAVPLSI